MEDFRENLRRQDSSQERGLLSHISFQPTIAESPPEARAQLLEPKSAGIDAPFVSGVSFDFVPLFSQLAVPTVRTARARILPSAILRVGQSR
jgi:hypothetical protein